MYFLYNTSSLNSEMLTIPLSLKSLTLSCLILKPTNTRNLTFNNSYSAITIGPKKFSLSFYQEYIIEKRVSNFHIPYQNEPIKYSKLKQLPSKNC